MSRLAPRVLLASLGVLLLLAPPASAERRTPTRPEDRSSSTTTAAPPSTSTTTTPAAPGDIGAGGDTAGGQTPDVDVSVPPPDDPSAPHEPSVAIVGDLSSAQDRLDEAQRRSDDADARIDDLQARLDEVDARIVTMSEEKRRAIERVEDARVQFQDRAVDAYMRGGSGDLEATLAADDPNDAMRNSAMMESVLAADNHAVDDYRAARREVSRELVRLADERTTTLGQLTQAKHWAKALRFDVRDARIQLAAFQAGSSIFVTGMVFPVDDPHNFIDSFGAPRSGGRQHQGADIFAAMGTNLFAVERGVIAKVGVNTLGGNRLWLYGESGTTYYYAHLSGWAPGIHDGAVVDAGDLVGYVGNTGDAITTPTHLHFEIHPGNGPAVDPTPLLQVVDALDDPLPPPA